MNTLHLKQNIMFITLFMLGTINMVAQTTSDSTHFGISASIQGTHTDILVPILINNMNILAPSFGIVSIQDAGTEIQLALVGRFYLSKHTVAPFLGGRVGTIIFSPTVGNALHDFIVGISGGGEYFFSRNLSIGIECQLTMGIDDKNSVRFGSPGGKELSSGTSLFATIYF